MGFYLYFCLILAGCLALFGVGIVSGLISLLQLRMRLKSKSEAVTFTVTVESTSDLAHETDRPSANSP